MEVKQLININNFKVYLVKNKYKVDCLDNEWRCECSTLYNRDTKKHCKHIKYIIENDERNKRCIDK